MYFIYITNELHYTETLLRFVFITIRIIIIENDCAH